MGPVIVPRFCCAQYNLALAARKAVDLDFGLMVVKGTHLMFLRRQMLEEHGALRFVE